MKKLFITLLLCLVFLNSNATKFNVTIVDQTYSPDLTYASIGDTISIEANTVHPLMQVSKANWFAGNNKELVGGWGTKLNVYTFKITNTDTIYFMCDNHGPSGMMGRIIVGSVLKNNALSSSCPLIIGNPIQNKQLIIQSSQNVNISQVNIYNSTGEMVFSGSAVNYKLDLNLLKSGIYFLFIFSDKKEILLREKFILE